MNSMTWMTVIGACLLCGVGCASHESAATVLTLRNVALERQLGFATAIFTDGGDGTVGILAYGWHPREHLPHAGRTEAYPEFEPRWLHLTAAGRGDCDVEVKLSGGLTGQTGERAREIHTFKGKGMTTVFDRESEIIHLSLDVPRLSGSEIGNSGLALSGKIVAVRTTANAFANALRQFQDNVPIPQ